MKRSLAVAAALTGILGINNSSRACDYHLLMGLPEPTGIWPTDPTTAVNQIKTADALDDAAITSTITMSANILAAPAISPSVDTYVTSWMINTNGATGKSTDTTINNAVKSIPANVQQVRYTSTNVYIKATGIPDYNIGPFNGNPNVPANDNATFDIPRNPQTATTHTATGLGAIGVLINGVDVFNMSDAMSYQNLGVWHNNAGVVEAPSFDAAKAHPQQQGVYHNHENPVSLEAEIGASSTNPAVIGYAIDGYPIMNGYASLTSGGPVVKMMSGYQLKTYAGNVRGNGGPNVAGQYVDGYFEEDYQYVANQTLPAGQAELDQFNGAFVYTPQFPSGTYAYFATTDNSGNAAYPYLLGPQYYGTPSSDDLPGSTVTVPADSTIYVAPEPSAALGFLLAMPLILRRRIHK
jgi:hypothetical protein